MCNTHSIVSLLQKGSCCIDDRFYNAVAGDHRGDRELLLVSNTKLNGEPRMSNAKKPDTITGPHDTWNWKRTPESTRAEISAYTYGQNLATTGNPPPGGNNARSVYSFREGDMHVLTDGASKSLVFFGQSGRIVSVRLSAKEAVCLVAAVHTANKAEGSHPALNFELERL
jgi:hypothetical protein